MTAFARRTRVLQLGDFGVFLTQAETLYVEENALSMLSRYETALERQIYRVQNDEL